MSYPNLLKPNNAKQFIVLFFCVLISTHRLFAQLPAGFSKTEVQTNYTNPVGMVFSGDGSQFFVWEKSGKIWVSAWNGSAYVRQTTPVLDISEEVGDWNDFGLHSVCFDPNFQANGLVYLFYQVDLHHLLYFGTAQYDSTANLYHHATVSRVTRYRLQKTGDTLSTDYTSRAVLLGETKTTGIPVTFESHAGGTLLFGRDGTLLLSTGDGGHHEGVDVGSRADTYFQESLNQGMMRPNENVGAMRSQMANSMCGKILRIDPATGNGVPTNPFYDAAHPREPQSRVWTLGLRNPYRITLQPGTGSTVAGDGNPGTLLVADVGWYQFEDFHVVDKAGLNCGWPLYEGLEPTISYYGTHVPNADEPGQPTFESLCIQPTSFIDNPNPALRRFTHSRPALDYNHVPVGGGTYITRVPAFNGTMPITRLLGSAGAPDGTSFSGYCIIGGVYYTGDQFPALYKNTYFLIDHSQGWIKNIELHNEGDHAIHEVRDFAPDSFEQGIVDMTMNPRDGSLYYVRIQGTVAQISYGGNQPPVANASSSTVYGASPLSVSFTGSNSVDPEGQALTYLWNFGDGDTSTTANPVHIFADSVIHKFTVTLVVTDSLNQQSTPKTLVVSVNNTPPVVQITNPVAGTLYSMSEPTSYTLQAAVTDTDTTNIRYEWQVVLQHNFHTHPEPILTDVNPTITISPVGCSPNETYSYLISVKVTDNGGLTATHSVVLQPDCNSASALVSYVTPIRQVSAVQVNWVNPSVTFDEVMVVVRENSSFLDTPSGTSYTANSSFTGNGTPIEGGKVVYRGTGTTVTTTELNPLIQYYFRIYTRVGTRWNGGVEVSAVPNLPPVAFSTASLTAVTGQVFSYTVPAFTDPESQTLTYTATGLPAWLSFNPVTRKLTGTPTQATSYTINIQAIDPGSLAASTVLIIHINPNQPPIPPTLTARTAFIGQVFSYTVPAFTDPEGQPIIYSATGLPAWVRFDSTTRELSGTPTAITSYTILIKATDPANLTAVAGQVIHVDSCSMFTIKAGNWNDPTVWSCNRIPVSSDAIHLNHIITIPGNYVAFALNVVYSQGASLQISNFAKLRFSP